MAEDNDGGEAPKQAPAAGEKTIQSLPVWKPPPPADADADELGTRQLTTIPPAPPAPAEPELPTQSALPVVHPDELPAQTTVPVAPAAPAAKPEQQGWTPPQVPAALVEDPPAPPPAAPAAEAPKPVEAVAPEPPPAPPPVEAVAPEPAPAPPPVEAMAPEPAPPSPPVEAVAPEPAPAPPPVEAVAPEPSPAPPPVEAVAPEPPPAPPVEAVAPEPAPAPAPVQAVAPDPPRAPEPAKPDHGWAVVEEPEEKPMVPVKGPDPDLRAYAEWFTWMKTGGAQVPVCHLGAQAAVQAAKTTTDVNQIVQAVNLAVSTGATAGPVDQLHQAYCGFYALAAIDFKLESPKAHLFADAAAEVIDKGGNIEQATAAARAAAGLPA